jgi:uncharacterized repeat protein (TIGR02543 family)
MKGKFWSLCAALVLCLVLLPATAHAAEHEHPVCGATCDGDCGGGHSPATWQPFSTDAWNAMQADKEYCFYLTGNVTVTDTLLIKSDTTVHLCLNGYILDGSSQDDSIFFLGSAVNPRTDGNLTLCDCQTTEHTGHIDSETHLWTQDDGSGAGTPCNLTGGVITGTQDSCVYVHSGTFTMYGGNLAGNTASRGGAISLAMSAASFTMYGGAITGNTATDGGGIKATGTVNMSGGSISNNTSTGRGGGIYASSVTINGGSISGNSAANGGGVYITTGTCSISSTARISNNFATDGGGICVAGGICDINADSNISNNTATYGGGVCITGGTCNIKAGSSISNNSATDGGGVYVNGGICNLYGNIYSNTADNQGGGVSMYGGVCNLYGSISNNTSTGRGGGVYVKNSGSRFEMDSGSSISGNTANRQGSDTTQTGAGGGVFVELGGTFNMSGGSISDNTADNRGGGVLMNSDSTFNMSDGSISGNNTAGNGGGLYIENTSVLNMSGGSISNNSAYLGSGVYAFHDSIQLNLSGASVIDGVIHSRDGGNLITINGALTGSTKFQLNHVSGTFTSGWKEKMGEADPADYFILNETGYHVGLGNDGEAAVFANTYTVVFNPGEGEGSMNLQAFTYDDEEKPLTPNGFTRTGYTFDGWRDSNGRTYTDGQKVKNLTAENNGTVTLTAQWKANTYDVTLNPNGGTINSGNVTIYTYGVGATLPTDVTRTGYTFKGWYDNASCTGTPVTEITATDLGDKEFWAKWTPNTYTVTLHPNGGTINSGNVTNYTYGVSAALPTDVTRTGYTFEGWYDNASCTGAQVAEITATDLGSKEFWAKWTPNTYTVTLHPNGGTIADGKDVTRYTYGVGAALPTREDMTHFGYIFEGWYDNEKLEGEPVTEITATDIGNKSYWAKWDDSSFKPSYSVLLGDYAHGSVHTSHRTPEAGTTVTLTVTPDAGYELASLTVTAKSGSKLTLMSLGDGKYSFKMPAEAVTVEAVFVPAGTAAFPFTDVPESYWAYDEIVWVYTNGYMNGTSATTFNPGGTVTRQQVWMILARLSGADPANMAEAKAWAKANGISDGTNPGNPVTRQQLAAMLYRYAQSQGQGFTGAWAFPLDYPDADQVADYAYEALCWMTMHGIIGGMADGTLNPGGTSTRAQLAVMLYRWLS